MATSIILGRNHVKQTTAHTAKKSLLSRYLAYCDSQMKQRTLWYLIPLISLCAAVMPIGIFLMSYFAGYLLFVGFSMLLFFTNIVVNISEQHTRVTITTYWVTVALHLLIPFLCYIFL